MGMLLDPAFLIDNWPTILLIVAIIIAIKAIAIFGIVIIFGYTTRIALLTAAGLFQIGEFGFIIAQGGLETGIIAEPFYSAILASAVITMILTPLFISLVAQLHRQFVLAMGKRTPDMQATEQMSVASQPDDTPKRVIIAGYGEVGQSIANGLSETNIPFLVIDDDPERVSAAKVGGHPRIYGDATNVNVLSKTNLGQACALVVAYPDPTAVLTTVKLAQLLNPDILILARASRRNEIDRLKQLGVNELVIPEHEAGYKFVKVLLSVVGLERDERRSLLAKVRKTMAK
jgi:CPA2 family monovalent cation:H+ antiporter-2